MCLRMDIHANDQGYAVMTDAVAARLSWTLGPARRSRIAP